MAGWTLHTHLLIPVRHSRRHDSLPPVAHDSKCRGVLSIPRRMDTFLPGVPNCLNPLHFAHLDGNDLRSSPRLERPATGPGSGANPRPSRTSRISYGTAATMAWLPDTRYTTMCSYFATSIAHTKRTGPFLSAGTIPKRASPWYCQPVI